MQLSWGFSGGSRFALDKSNFHLLNALSLANSEKEAVLPDVLERVSWNSSKFVLCLQSDLGFL